MKDSFPGGNIAAAEVYINTPVDRPFTYRVPEGMKLEHGMRAVVNFRGRKVTGYVTGINTLSPSDIEYELKDVVKPVDDEPVFDKRLIDLARYVSGMYFSSMGEALAKALPSSESSRIKRKPPSGTQTGRYSAGSGLTEKQREIFEQIASSGPSAHLVYGITGSGKTEIYMEMARKVIESGRSVIYLVPEISLSSQIYDRLLRVFGNELVLYHSMLTPNQRLLNWNRFRSGDARIAIGTRSAVFMQPPNLGLIIIDEEQDGSYKEQSSPRYSARHIAFYRAKKENAHLILGSATPSIETLHAAERGSISLHTLTERYGDAELPAIEIVKVRGDGNEISSRLKLYTMRAVSSGKQAVYLLNRRGFSPLVMCDQCGKAFECQHCSIAMNYHRDKGMLCHYCGSAKPVPKRCPACGSESMVHVGAGTQRIEELLSSEFPGFRIFRLDQDSARRKETVAELVERMDNGSVDILLGTQMVSKGFDFPGITVAGILLADIGLNMPDFRAQERIVSLLIQLAGRSGRGGGGSRVVVQTYNESHEIFTWIKNHDYTSFYRAELEVRKMLGYPPFTRLARLVFRGRNEAETEDTARRLGEVIDGIISSGGLKVEKLGPAAAPFAKIAGSYRYHIILKASGNAGIAPLVKEAMADFKSGQVYIEVDIDPADML